MFLARQESDALACAMTKDNTWDWVLQLCRSFTPNQPRSLENLQDYNTDRHLPQWVPQLNLAKITWDLFLNLILRNLECCIVCL